ncbi:MAG: hypothetical protein ABNH26_10945 [Celeribacter sp.]|jgi:hypothetical protein
MTRTFTLALIAVGFLSACTVPGGGTSPMQKNTASDEDQGFSDNQQDALGG